MNMTPPIRVSPIHESLQQYRPEWRECGDARIAWRYDSAAADDDAVRTLGLCDLSPLAKLGLKGPNASVWLQEQGATLPASIFEALHFIDDGWIVRLGSDEFLLENGFEGDWIAQLDANLGRGRPGVTRIERQEATFLITGTRAPEVLAQSCGINFHEVPEIRLVITRVAGVNCSILTEGGNDLPRYRLWVDPTYAVALWNSLEQISRELGGQVVGASVLARENK
jgi:sarcosine oxidase subunit gamma